MTDLLLKGGEVIDPSQAIRGHLDVAVKDGAISQVAPNISSREAARVIDVSGVKGGVKTYQRGVDVQRLCQGNGPAIMSVVAVSSQ